MPDVWVLVHEIDYEGERVIGVFSSAAAALDRYPMLKRYKKGPAYRARRHIGELWLWPETLDEPDDKSFRALDGEGE